MTKHIVFWGLCTVLVFVPLPIGSVEEWAVFVFEAATIGLFLVYLGGEIGARGRAKSRNAGPASGWAGEGLAGVEDKVAPASLPRFIKYLLGVFLVVSLLQFVPLPAGILKLLSPRAYDIFVGLSRDGIAAPSPWLTLSLAPSATLSELVLILCYGIFGFLVLRTVRSRRQVEIFVVVIVASALFQALYGMAETFSGSERIFGYTKKYTGCVTGTYINRNHFAGFMEMVFPLSLGYLLVKARYFAMEKGLSIRQRILWFGQESLQWTLLLGLVPAFIGVGLVFSKSRSGIMVFVVTAVMAAAATAAWREFSEVEGEGHGAGGARRRFGRIVRLVVMIILAAVVWLGIGPVIDRFAEADLSREGRIVVYKNTLEMIGDYPWAGTGKGTYVDAYAIYEKVDDGMKLSYAHNDYLEFAAENGVVAGGALAAAGIGLAIWLAAMWRRCRSSFAKGIGLGAMLGVTAILIHGFTDFNLQIPANAVYFTALAMLGVVVLGREKKGDMYLGYVSPDPQERGHVPEVHVPGKAAGEAAAESDPWRAIAGYRRLGWFGRMRRGPLGPSVAALLALILFVPAFHDFRGFHYLGEYRRARSEARNVESAFPTLEALLEKAVNASPRSEFRIELARLYTEMARVANDSGRDEDREAFCDKAVASYGMAIAANPAHAFTFYETGLVYLLSNYPLMTYADRAKTYFRKALELKPADDSLNLNVIFLHFNWWTTIEDAEKAYATWLYRQAVARDPGFPAKLEARWKQSFKTADRLAAILGELR